MTDVPSSPGEGAKPGVSLLTAVSLVVANMVGTGVFVSLGFQLVDIPTGFPILLLWITGGVLSFCGALCYAELGAMLPRSGGEYHLLSQTWHPVAGFLAGWVSMTVGFAVPVAVAAATLGAYLESITGGVDSRWISLPVVILVTAVHLGGLRRAGRFQVCFTTLKLVLILVLIAAATVSGNQSGVRFSPQPGDVNLVFAPEFAVSLVYVMYAYTGWNAAVYIAGEIRDPQRSIPRALLIGTVIVTALYIGLNGAFLLAAPTHELAGQPEVALVAAQHLFGEDGGSLMGVLISLGLISTISAMTWAGPRVAQAMGEDHRLFAFLSQKSRRHVPARAILLQAVLVVVMLLIADLDEMIRYIESILILSSAMVVAGLIWLRRKAPDAPRPYRAWGYPFTPLLFLAASALMLVYLTAQHPTESLVGLLTLIAGAILYGIGRSDKASIQRASSRR